MACREVSLVERLIGCDPDCGDLSWILLPKEKKKLQPSCQKARQSETNQEWQRANRRTQQSLTCCKTNHLERRERRGEKRRRWKRRLKTKQRLSWSAVIDAYYYHHMLLDSATNHPRSQLFLLGAMQVTQFWQSMMLSAPRRACFGASDLRWPQPAVRQCRRSGDELG